MSVYKILYLIKECVFMVYMEILKINFVLVNKISFRINFKKLI